MARTDTAEIIRSINDVKRLPAFTLTLAALATIATIATGLNNATAFLCARDLHWSSCPVPHAN